MRNFALLLALATLLPSSLLMADACSAGIGVSISVPEGQEALAGITVQCAGFTFGNGLTGAQGGAVFLDPSLGTSTISDVVLLSNINVNGVEVGVATFVSDLPICLPLVGCIEPGIPASGLFKGLGIVTEPGAFVTDAISLNGGQLRQFTFASDTAGGSDVSDTLTIGAPAPVPEPGTLGLFATGLFGLAGIARRKWSA